MTKFDCERGPKIIMHTMTLVMEFCQQSKFFISKSTTCIDLYISNGRMQGAN
jgi:hypothetical protein